jgi:hypothetical protein
LVRVVFPVSVLLAACASVPPAQGPRGGTGTPLPAPGLASGTLDAWHVLGDVPARALRLWAGTPSLVAAGLAVENDWIGGFVEVPLDECVLVYARGAISVTDVDVAVYSDDGAILAADEERDAHPTVVLCPPHPLRVYVAGHLAEGEGFVAVGADLVAKERATMVAQGLAVHGSLEQGSVPSDVGPDLDDAVRRRHLELGGQWEEMRRLALTVDARVPAYVTLAIDAGHCVDAFVVPGDDIGPLDAEIADSDGRTLSRSRDGSGARGLIVCSSVAMTGSLAVRPHIGRGVAAIVLARADADVYRDISGRPEVAWFAPRRSLQAAKVLHEAALANAGYGAPVAVHAGLLTLASRSLIPIEDQASDGACLRVDVTGGEPLALVDARLWADGGALLASDEAPSSALLFACARGIGRLELEARGRPGPFSMTVRPERWRDPAFEHAPLAASRMLARAVLGPERVLLGNERSVRIVLLDAANVFSWNETIPADRCVRVSVGVEGEGAGVEIRAFDETNVEVDRGEGPEAVMVRACASGAAGRPLHFEMRASAGNLRAVVGERLD